MLFFILKIQCLLFSPLICKSFKTVLNCKLYKGENKKSMCTALVSKGAKFFEVIEPIYTSNICHRICGRNASDTKVIGIFPSVLNNLWVTKLTHNVIV